MSPKAYRSLFIAVTLLVTPLAVLLVSETLLSLGGYRSPFIDEDPFLGFTTGSPLFEQLSPGESSEPVYATRHPKLRWFNFQEFPVTKPANGYRIFTFGGSTTFGRPYAVATSYSNWLRVLLNRGNPERSYEVINTGGVSYASYRIVNLMTEMAAYKPDLFVVHIGHNEFLEERTYGELKEEPALLSSTRRLLQSLKTYGLVQDLVTPLRSDSPEADQKFTMTADVSALLDQSAGIDRYHRDSLFTSRVLDHLRQNLHRMIDVAEANNIEIMFVVPASNVKDFSPFKSSFSVSLSPEQAEEWHREYSWGMGLLGEGHFEDALVVFDRLATVDPQYADVRFRKGLAHFSLKEFENAKAEFRAACDNDIAPLRATSQIQEIVREVALERNIPSFDLPRYLEDLQRSSEGHECLGNEFLYDHCHLTIEVHQKLAKEIMNVAVREFAPLQDVSWKSVNEKAVFDSVMATLGPEYFGLRNLNLAKVLRWAGKKAEAEPFVRRAAAELPDHPEAEYLLGLLYQEKGEFDSAMLSLRRAIALDPTNANAQNSLGSVYLKTSRVDQAIVMFRKAIALNPGLGGFHYNLGNAYVQRGSPDSAIMAYNAELKIDPGHTMALNNLGYIHLVRREYDIAEPLFQRVLDRDPNNIEAYSNLGIIAFLREDYDGSIRMFEAALRIRPDDSFSRQWMDRIVKVKTQRGGR